MSYNTYILNDKGEVDFQNGELYISVSTILKTENPGDFLTTWLLRTFGGQSDPLGAYKGFMDEVSTLGTAIHKYVEYDLEKKEFPKEELTENMIPAIAEWHAWREKHEIVPILNEAVLFSKKLRVAGTMDLLCTIDGKKYVADIKTGTVKDIAFTQMIAYKAMAAEMGLAEVADADLAVISLHRDGRPVEIHTRESWFNGNVSQEDLFAKFQALRYIWYLNNLKSRKFKPIIKHWDQYMDPLIERFKSQLELFVKPEQKPVKKKKGK